MKQQILSLCGFLALSIPLFAQQIPTNDNPFGSSGGITSNQFWSRGGNLEVTGDNNIFGTLWNSPIYSQTNGVGRMKLNGTNTAYSYLSTTIDVSGHLGIGLNGYFNTNEPLTMLHLSGPNNTTFNGGSYRTWMRTGMFANENSDAMYVGLKPEAGTNRSDAIIYWADDASTDKLRFLFGTTMVSLPGTVNPLTGASSEGYEFMRMQAFGVNNHAGYPIGHVGIGPLFTDALPPQNRLHMNAESGLPTFLQISNVSSPSIAGSGQTGTDGLKIGLQNFVSSQGNRQYGYLQWQEHTPFIVQSAFNSTGTMGERMRITSIGALVNTEGSAYGGLTSPTNETRVSISYLGSSPVDKPRSLLHLGINGGTAWRSWMDVGTYTSGDNSHMYSGFNGISNDVVMNWGGPTLNNMMFVFTAASGSAGEAGTADGLEGMRMTPTANTGVFTGIGGDPNSNPYGPTGTSQNPTATLEVNGLGLTSVPGGTSGLRFTNLNSTSPTIANPGNGLLSVDADGDIIYVPFPPGSGGSVGAHNGTTMSLLNASNVAFGQDLNQAGAPGKLLNTREVPMNDFNIVFTNVPNTSSAFTNRIGIGTNAPTAKLDVNLGVQVGTVTTPTAVNVVNSQTATGPSSWALGQRITVNGNNNSNRGQEINVSAGTGSSQGSSMSVSGSSGTNTAHTALILTANVTGLSNNTGVSAAAISGRNNYAGRFSSSGVSGTTWNRGVYSGVIGTAIENTAIMAEVNATGTVNYGVKSTIFSNSGTSYGVFASCANNPNQNNRAGYFAGKLETTAAQVIVGSDSIFKTDVTRLSGSLKLLQGLRPVSYNLKTTEYAKFNFDDHKQFGFIAQQLEDVFPNLVYNSLYPAEYDEFGSIISPAIPYKSVNYGALIPVNTQAIIELDQKVEQFTLSDQSMKTNVLDLTGSLDKVLEMRGVSYDWIHTVHPELNLDSVNHIGFIAQELAAIDSRLTYVTSDSLLHVEYDKVVPILAEAIQELNGQVVSKDSIITAQQTQIDDLNDRLTQLENCLSGILPYLCQLSNSAIQANTPEAQEQVRKNLNVTLTNRAAIILDQNVPNPFAEQTVINFSIPSSVQKAQIHFYDGHGKLMQSVDITERGAGSITVFGSDLSTGVYTYSLIADGQIVATKKMMKQ